MLRELEYRYEGEGTRKYIDILLLFTRYPVEAVHQAVSTCVKRRAFSDEAVESVLSYQPPSLSTTLDLSDRPLLQMESLVERVVLFRGGSKGGAAPSSSWHIGSISKKGERRIRLWS